jgi:HK97 gp10 family phage protein
MTIKFDSPLKFAEHLVKVATVELIAINKALDVAGKMVKAEAKHYIGHLQDKIGSAPVGDAWDELAESTKADKQRLVDNGTLSLSLNADFNPLMRTGELYRSIDYTVNMQGLEVVIGSTSPIAAFQEFGTQHIPPRPFIGRAAYELGPKLAAIFGAASVVGIAGGHLIESSIGSAIGYNQDIEL